MVLIELMHEAEEAHMSHYSSADGHCVRISR